MYTTYVAIDDAARIIIYWLNRCFLRYKENPFKLCVCEPFQLHIAAYFSTKKEAGICEVWL